MAFLELNDVWFEVNGKAIVREVSLSPRQAAFWR
jgi:iron complex transport system ATP-binding protein